MTSVFLNKSMFLLLALVPLLVLLFAFAAIKRRKAIAMFLNSSLRDRLMDPAATRKRRISELCLIASLVFIVLGIARPVWDTETIQYPKTSRDLVFMLDISQSMLAEDQPPNRMICAKNSIIQCLDEFRSGRVGLVIFAGSTSIRCPLTRDFEFFKSTLEDLAPDSVPIGGTRIGDAILKTTEKVLSDDADYRDVILITDGGDQAEISTNSVAGLIESGARLIIIGLGSDSVPATIPIMDTAGNNAEPLSYNESVVLTKQETVKLQNIADMVPGSIYINVGTNPFDLAHIYRAHVNSTLSTYTEDMTIERPKEQFWRFLLAAIIFICASLLPTRNKPSTPAGKRSLTALSIMLIFLSAPALHAESRSSMFKNGVGAYHEGNYASALEHFSAAEQKKADPAIEYNMGTAYYRQGDMTSALLYFSSAAETTQDSQLAVDSLYNAGNSMFKLAFSEATTSKAVAIDLVQQSISAYEYALSIEPEHEDALYNINVAQNAMELLEKSDSQNSENQDSSEETETEDDDFETEESDADEGESTNQQSDDDMEEQSAPNLSPDDILQEEADNKLNRSRKKHAEFAETKKNW